ncbi:type II secretion system protein GspC [Aliivibrio fischeri]|uniref:type II secretion system protein GspC n=1 Tax=Aliivibrio fischeri TaxID=668 RepID=UPI0012D8EEEC|nr:type II secretion system protein GspC [Aliivibrio fischeri]MUK28349.1 type II secretion system protein GspC [Aliivibrio fischeri]MUK33437.1 type II secretion system protein GspC [Aliivibrio fischeri]
MITNMKIEKISQYWSIYQSTIAKSLTVILVAWFAWICGSLFWSMLAPQTSVSKWTPKTVAVAVSQGKQGKDSLSELLNSQVFGRFNAENKVDQPKAVEVKDAPKTRLNLTLSGVVASSEPSLSLAVIANRGKQNTYGINETIDGTRASVKAISADRIIISNNGRDETLMLEGVEYTKISNERNITGSSGTVLGNNRQNSNQDELDKIRKEMAQNPQSVLKYIRLSQVSDNGKIKGYRVNPGKDRKLFDSVGLKPGDIATSLNGVDLTDPAAMSSLWKNMSEMTELNLTVLRNGQLYDIFVGL